MHATRTLGIIAFVALAWSGTASAEGRPPVARGAPSPQVQRAASAATPPLTITGTYDSAYGEVTLRRSGSRVTGSYVCCGGGTIRGVAIGQVVLYEWHQPGASGRGVWVIRGGRLVGTWGVGASEDNGGVWSLTPATTYAAPPAQPTARR